MEGGSWWQDLQPDLGIVGDEMGRGMRKDSDDFRHLTHIFICHLSKRVTLVLKVIPLNVCLLVTAEGTFYWFSEWCTSLWSEDMATSWEKPPEPSGSLSAEGFFQPIPGPCPTLQWWMVLHPCWSLMYSHCSTAFSFSAPVCQCSSVKSDMCRDCFDQPGIKCTSSLNKALPVIMLGIWS